MKPRRQVLYVGLALLAAHIVVLAWFGEVWPGPILSDIVQFLIGTAVFLACLQAIQLSLVFGRLFWRLAAFAVFLWCIGQALDAYYGSYLNLPTASLWQIYIFLVAWPAPLAMCLFLDPEEEREGMDWRRLLDFAQVAILFVLMFLSFSTLSGQTSAWSTNVLSLATDGLVSGAFFARALTLRDNSTRKLFLGIGAFRAVALLTDIYFVLGLPQYGTGAWFDLVWSVPWMIPLVAAASWAESPKPSRAPQRRLQSRSQLITHVLPLIFPVLVVVTAANIAPTQVKLAALAVLLSLGISYARLLLTHSELRRSAEALRDHDELLNAIIEGSTAAIFVKDPLGRYVLINSAGAALVGRSVPEILGKDDTALFSPESARLGCGANL